MTAGEMTFTVQLHRCVSSTWPRGRIWWSQRDGDLADVLLANLSTRKNMRGEEGLSPGAQPRIAAFLVRFPAASEHLSLGVG